jgi:hypothetical protein
LFRRKFLAMLAAVMAVLAVALPASASAATIVPIVPAPPTMPAITMPNITMPNITMPNITMPTVPQIPVAIDTGLVGSLVCPILAQQIGFAPNPGDVLSTNALGNLSTYFGCADPAA